MDVEDIIHFQSKPDYPSIEGIQYYDGWNATFWYMLNHEWFLMNNRLTSAMHCTEVYEEPADIYWWANERD